MKKLYCYVDGTGQDTKGEIFLVCVVIVRPETKEKVEHDLLEIEPKIGKKTKWISTRPPKRLEYLERILNLKALQRNLFFGIYKGSTEYLNLATETIIKAIQSSTREPYQVTVAIDGLNRTQREKIKRLLKAGGIKYRKVQGPSWRSNPFIRLADALAGFSRAANERKLYSQELFDRFVRKGFLNEVKNKTARLS